MPAITPEVRAARLIALDAAATAMRCRPTRSIRLFYCSDRHGHADTVLVAHPYFPPRGPASAGWSLVLKTGMIVAICDCVTPPVLPQPTEAP